MGFFPLRRDCEPNSVDGVSPTRRSNSSAGISPTRRSGSPLHCWDFFHLELTHPICRSVTPHSGLFPICRLAFQRAYDCKKHMVYTLGFVCLDYPLDVLVSCDYKLEASNILERHSPMYYLNITFVNVCMCYSSGTT